MNFCVLLEVLHGTGDVAGRSIDYLKSRAESRAESVPIVHARFPEGIAATRDQRPYGPGGMEVAITVLPRAIALDVLAACKTKSRKRAEQAKYLGITLRKLYTL